MWLRQRRNYGETKTTNNKDFDYDDGFDDDYDNVEDIEIDVVYNYEHVEHDDV